MIHRVFSPQETVNMVQLLITQSALWVKGFSLTDLSYNCGGQLDVTFCFFAKFSNKSTL